MKLVTQEDHKKEVEAVLFAAGTGIDIATIASMCNIKDLAQLRKILEELKKDYLIREGPLIVFEEGSKWKLMVREKYLPIVQKIVPHTELNKTILETLAVIAWKYPILQSELVRIRTNKAYDHIAELEELGFLTKVRKGRSYLLKLTQKFFDYFDLKDKTQVKDVFKDFKSSGQKTLDDPLPETQDGQQDESKPLQKKDNVLEGVDESHTSDDLDSIEEPIGEETKAEEVEINIENNPEEVNSASTDNAVDGSDPTIVVGGKKLTHENIEKLKKAQEIMKTNGT